MSKVAVGCASFEALRNRQARRERDGFVPVLTRFRPKRADEMIGGSIFWIVKHRIAARQTILGFEDGRERKTVIRLDPEVVRVTIQPKRAHQGWRYLEETDAPADLCGDSDGMEAIPPALALKLSALALL